MHQPAPMTAEEIRAWFAGLPLNRAKAYAAGVAPGGCIVYAPTTTQWDEEMTARKEELQFVLDQLDGPPQEAA